MLMFKSESVLLSKS